MIQDLWKRMEAKTEKMQEVFTKGLDELKNKQREMNNTLERIRSRITMARMMEIPATEQNIERRTKRNEDSLRDLWHTNFCIIRVPEGEGREKGPEIIFEEIIAENFLNIGSQVKEAQRVQEE